VQEEEEALMRARTAVVLIGLVIAVAVTGIAIASIPDSNGVIHGCYRNASGPGDDRAGDLRVIDPGPTGRPCEPDETPLNWSQGGASTVYQAVAARKKVGKGLKVRVLAATPPPGMYAINAKTRLLKLGKGGAVCKLFIGGLQVDAASQSADGLKSSTYPLQFAGQLNGDPISVYCTSSRDSVAYDTKIAAIRIGEVVALAPQ
jgi:hypothetical protein